MKKKLLSYKLSDEFIARILMIVQEAMISGTDVLDLFRQMEIKPDAEDPHVVVLTDQYKETVDRWHNQIEEMLVARRDAHECDVIKGEGDCEVAGGTIQFTKVN
jgi:hypothetical protein